MATINKIVNTKRGATETWTNKAQALYPKYHHGNTPLCLMSDNPENNEPQRPFQI
jgi:hypothetical protein